MAPRQPVKATKTPLAFTFGKRSDPESEEKQGSETRNEPGSREEEEDRGDELETEEEQDEPRLNLKRYTPPSRKDLPIGNTIPGWTSGLALG